MDTGSEVSTVPARTGTGPTARRRTIPTTKSRAQIAFKEIQENFRPALGFVQRDNARLLRIGASYNPRPALPQHPADVPRRVLHALYQTRQQSSRKLGSVHRPARLAPALRRQRACGHRYRIRPTNASSSHSRSRHGVILLPGEYRFLRHRSVLTTAAKRRVSGSLSLGWGEYWSGRAEQIDRFADLQVASTIHHEHVVEPDVCAAARRAFHRADLHVECELRRFAVAVVFEPRFNTTIDREISDGRAAMRWTLAARQRSVCRVQPGLGAGTGRKPQPAVQNRRQPSVQRSFSIPTGSEEGRK